MKITKATDAEKIAWSMQVHTDGEYSWSNLYPLHGYITIAGQRCAVEALPEVENRYEVHAPGGYHFSSHGTHTLMATDKKDLIASVSYETFEKCGENC